MTKKILSEQDKNKQGAASKTPTQEGTAPQQTLPRTEASKPPADDIDAAEMTRILLGALAYACVLSESGSSVNGQLTLADAKVRLYGVVYAPKKTRTEPTWGEILTRDTANALVVEKVLARAIWTLENNAILRQTRDVFNEQGISFTPEGYRRYLALVHTGADVAQLAISPPATQFFRTAQVEKKAFELTEEKKKTLLSDLLLLVYDYNARFNKKISFDELMLRCASQMEPALKRFQSWRHIAESKEYDQKATSRFEKSVRAEILGAFRDNLVEYETSLGLVAVTAAGQAKINETTTGSSQAVLMAPETVTTRVIHLSDLHFGSHKFTGIDNKDRLPQHDLAQLELPLFKSLITKIIEISSADSLLIVSGDITTKNEEAGYAEFAKFLGKLPFGRDRIYLIPGNHDYDRKASPGRMRHAGFLAHLSDYANPLSQTPYLLDGTTRTFILGFNSVHTSGDGDELFYVAQDEIIHRRELVKALESNGSLKGTIRIAVVHNSMLPHSGVEIKKYGDLLNLFRLKYELIDWKFSTVLSGHKHDPLFERHQTYAVEGSGALLLMSAASTAGTVIGAKNGFHVVDYERDANTGILLKTHVTLYEVDRLGTYQEKEHLLIDNR